MKTELVSISRLKNNSGQIKGLPKNPRILKDYKFEKLKKSLQDDPEMLNLREVIAYDNNSELIVICGNMRLKALKELGVKEVPTKILPSNTPIEKLKAYLIKDNNSFGDWDTDALTNDWDLDLLDDWGVEMPSFDNPNLQDYSDKNQEIDLDEDEKNSIVLEYTSEDFILVKTALSKIASTPEQAVYKLLFNE